MNGEQGKRHERQQRTEADISGPGWILRLGFRSPRLAVPDLWPYVKISAPYRTSEKSPDFSDMAPLARLLVAANPDRILWGSNWPHPGRGPIPSAIAPPYPNDDGRVLNLLPTWVPSSNPRDG
jgi:hypothetical protein